MARKQLPYTQMTLKAMRERGRYVWKVEFWNQYARRPGGELGIRQDCFGFIDLLVIDPTEGIIAVQSTSGSCHSEHRKKILRNDYALRWAHFNKIELWSWKNKLGNVSVSAKGWEPRIEPITLNMFVEFTQQAS